MKQAIVPILVPLLFTAGLHAGTTAVSDTLTASTTAPVETGWSFRIAPYAWLTAIDGDIGIGPLTAPVDISFSDTLDKLDMAYMFLVEAGYGRWTLTADFVYGDFSNDIAGGGRVFNSFRYEYTQWVFTPTLGYRVIETDDYSMDVFAGARVTSFDTSLTGRLVGGGQLQRSADDTWTDPIIGIRGQSELSERWFLRYNADIGGFGVSSDLVWQAFLGLGYKIRENASLAVGYRGLGIDYSSGAYSTLDVINHGPLIGFEFRF
jgi:opacity protein-like surface antigen